MDFLNRRSDLFYDDLSQKDFLLAVSSMSWSATTQKTCFERNYLTLDCKYKHWDIVMYGLVSQQGPAADVDDNVVKSNNSIL